MYTRVFRFAPSPNGYLHLGHAYSALLNHEMAQGAGGRLLLRIEDIDAERCRPEYEAAIYEDLQWLGVSWQQPARRQSEHLDDYAAALARLEGERLVYPSFESRSEIGALVAGQTGVVTLAPQLWGDVVLARKDAPASYHLAVAVDDALQGVSDVVRGQDLFWSTSIHRVLQALLGLPEPTYHHHRLILDADGRKLSKSTQATSLRELRGRGTTAADIRRMVGLGH